MAKTTTEKSEDIIPAQVQQPAIVINMGKASRSSVKKLKRGRGKLIAEVNEVLAQVKLELEESDNREILPVAVVYKKKRSRKNRRGLLSIFD